jgi:hypothetical protein
MMEQGLWWVTGLQKEVQVQGMQSSQIPSITSTH